MVDLTSILALALSVLPNFFNIVKFPPQAKIVNNAEYDYIIVGGGTAGCVVARRLAEGSDSSVLLLEAGDDPNTISLAPGLFFALPQTDLDYDYRATYDPYAAKAHDNRTKLTAGKGLGGSSILNHLLYSYDVPETFSIWEKITGDSSWNYQNMLRLMIKSQNLKDEKIYDLYPDYHGVDGPLGISRLVSDDETTEEYLTAQAEAGNPKRDDLNSDTPTGFAQPQYTIDSPNEYKKDTKGGIRQTTSYAYLKNYKSLTNLKVSKNTRVQRIIIENKVAVGVEAVYKGETYIFKANKEVILCAGVFNTPQILQLSGIGPKQHLESKGIEVVADLPAGDNLLIPPAVILVTKTKKHSSLLPLLPSLPLNLIGALPALNPTQLPFTVIQGSLSWNDSTTPDIPNAQIINLLIPHDTPFIKIACENIYGYNTAVCSDWQNQVKGRDAVMSVVINFEATSTGTVRLNTTNAADSPLITTGFYNNQQDLETFVKTIKDYNRVLDTPTYENYGAEVVGVDFKECSHLEYDTDEFWKCYILERTVPGFIYFGTAPMGSVVDGDLKVFEVENLRVCDASVIPIPVRAVTNAGVIAIAENCAEKILA